ncbi:MAG: hypothetical protein ACP5NX_00305 [Candidatus Bilamarchaeaceae archaeon]
MKMKREPAALACGLLKDGGRILFMLKRDAQGRGSVELPCVEIFGKEDPVLKLSVEFRRQTGIDAQVHEIIQEGRHNSGSRKRKKWVPALGFRMSAKEARAKPSSEFAGFAWLPMNEAEKIRASRNCEWLFSGAMRKSGAGSARD